MARGKPILISQPVNGHFFEGVIASGQTPKPGTVMQLDATVAMVGGRGTWTAYNRDADGNRPAGPLAILLEDTLQGRIETTAYAAGERCFLYIPQPGDEFNLIVADVGGTADIEAGTIMMVDDGTGKLVASSSPETEPFLLLETLSAPTADQLAHVQFSGY